MGKKFIVSTKVVGCSVFLYIKIIVSNIWSKTREISIRKRIWMQVTSSGWNSSNITVTRNRQGEKTIENFGQRRSMPVSSVIHHPKIQLNASLRWWSICPVWMSLDACATNRRRWYWIRCSMLSCLTPYMSSWMFSMSSFLHHLYALPSWRTTFAQQFQGVSLRFYAFIFYYSYRLARLHWTLGIWKLNLLKIFYNLNFIRWKNWIEEKNKVTWFLDSNCSLY